MHTVYCGDAIPLLEGAASLGLPSINLTVTSPPYDLDIAYQNSGDRRGYLDYKVWARNWLHALWKATADGGRLCLNIPLDTNKGGERPFYADMVKMAEAESWKYKSTIIWNEGSISRRTAWGSWRSATAPNLICPVEMIVVLYKGEWKRERPEGVPRYHVDRDLFMDSSLALWTFGGEKKKRFNHPAPFPEELPRRCLQMFSFPGDLVCDPFLGSGTTGAACPTDRDFIGIDISEPYTWTAFDRLAALHGHEAVTWKRFS